MADSIVPSANPGIILREEFDDWAVLFDPESGQAYGLDPVGVFYWKRFDGQNTREQVMGELKKECENVPDDAPDHLDAFITKLTQRGFVSCD